MSDSQDGSAYSVAGANRQPAAVNTTTGSGGESARNPLSPHPGATPSPLPSPPLSPTSTARRQQGGDNYLRAGRPFLLVDGETGTIMMTANKVNYVQALHTSLKLSGREIMELEKVYPSEDSRIYSGDLVYVRSHYQQIRGQMLSSFVTWSSSRDSKAQFMIQGQGLSLSGAAGRAPLTLDASFTLVSQHWGDLSLGRTMDEPFDDFSSYHASLSFGYLCLGKPSKSWFIPMTFKAIPTSKDQRLPPVLSLPPTRSPQMAFSCVRCGAANVAQHGSGRVVQCGNCLSYNRLPYVPAYRPVTSLSLLSSPLLVRTVTVPVTSYTTYQVQQTPAGEERYHCPQCGALFTDMNAIINHVDQAHGAASSLSLSSPPPYSAANSSPPSAATGGEREAGERSQCPLCGVVLPSAVAAVEHVEAAHKAQGALPRNFCSVCGSKLEDGRCPQGHSV